ncbi:MAG: hypothetical protein OEY86_12375, partial [Nitrospira sp.]|nr:hypothetical protein [Nitrospira sp.]
MEPRGLRLLRRIRSASKTKQPWLPAKAGESKTAFDHVIEGRLLSEFKLSLSLSLDLNLSSLSSERIECLLEALADAGKD